MYWTDLSSNSVSRALKTDGSEQLRIVSDLPAVSGITVVSKADLDRKGMAWTLLQGYTPIELYSSCLAGWFRRWGVGGGGWVDSVCSLIIKQL